MVVYTCSHNTWEAEAVGLPQVQGQRWIHREFQASLGYRVRLCLKNKKMEKGLLINICSQVPSQEFIKTWVLVRVSITMMNTLRRIAFAHLSARLCVCGGQRIIYRNNSLFLPVGSWGLYSSHFTSNDKFSVIPFLNTNSGKNKT